MGKKPSKARRSVLRLRDLDHSKASVLNSLGSPGSRRAYEFAMDEFIIAPSRAWRSTALWSRAIGSHSKDVDSPRPASTSGLQPCDGLPMRRRIAAC